jgi:type VI secretion system protein VasG
MIHIDIATVIGKLNEYCRHALEEAASLCISQHGDEVNIAHVLYKLAQNPYSDLRLILKQAQISHEDFLRHLSDSFVSNDAASEQYPSFSPLLIEAMQEAWLLSSLEDQATQIRSGSLFLAVLLNAGRYLPLGVIKLLENINRETLRKNFSRILSDSTESTNTESQNGSKQATASDAETPLDQYGINFTQAARDGKIDPVLCRDDEIDLMIDILSRRRKNNPIAVGDAGVGKSALVEGLALRIVAKKVPQALHTVELWGLDLGSMQAGASVKGEFEKRLKAVIDQVKNAAKPIILFIDEAHTIIGAGNQAGGSDAANLLKPALARGELRTIAATTWSEYKKYFEKDAALSRRFQLVKLDEPSVEDSVHILRGLRSLYEESHQVYITDEALTAAAALSARYVSGRQLPDKAVDVLDTAAARVTMVQDTVPKKLSKLDNRQIQIAAELELLEREKQHGRPIDIQRTEQLHQEQDQLETEKTAIQQSWDQQKALVEKIIAIRKAMENQGAEEVLDNENEPLSELINQLHTLQKNDPLIHLEVDQKQIAAVISDWTGIPVNTLVGDSLERLRNLDGYLNNNILGQVDAINKIHRHLLTAMADLKRRGTPLGAFLLIGPSGVGKTETAVQIADYLFGGKQFLTTINMSEYQEKHSLSRLIGSPPGYIGYGEGGVLSEAIRQRPYSVVLLDEVEKAHPDVLNLFYQAFDKGEIADGEGRIIDCKNILFFLTSNLGFDGVNVHKQEQGVDEQALGEHLRRFFKPALLARMQTVRFDYLDDESIHAIVSLRLQRLVGQFAEKYKAPLEFDQGVSQALRDKCTQRENGARMLDASIEGELLPPLSLQALSHVANGEVIRKAKLSYDGQHFSAITE